MDTLNTWGGQYQQSLSDFSSALVAFLPLLIAAVFLLLVGWILARLARRGAALLVRTTNSAIDRLVNRSLEKSVRLPAKAPQMAGDVVYWIVILLFATAAARKVGFTTISGWLERVVNYLPTLFAGFVIVGLGYLLSTLVRDLASGAAASAGFAQNRLLGLAAQVATFLVGLVIGLDQIGIDVSFLVIIIAVVLGSLSVGIALAFGLGARTFADNLINVRQLQRLYQRGQRVRLADIEGEILEFTQTSVVIAGKHGRSAVPARLFGEQASILVTPEEYDG